MKFGQLLKKARVREQKTLREVAINAGLSVSYVSDMEHGRRKPSSVDAVMKIERFLNVTDGSLLRAAQREKDFDVPSDAKEIYWQRPELSLALLRASTDLSEEEINELIEKIGKKSRKRGDQ